MSTSHFQREEIVYPDSDGQPMADNTKQYHEIVRIVGGLETTFNDDPTVFVAGDLLWYPVKGNNTIRMAPDAMVVFGRPKGYRGSYRQWEENDIAPQVVFEVLSPGNTRREMNNKRDFYERYGVEEYYVYDPERLKLEGWQRQGTKFGRIAVMNGWVSPLLKIRFELEPPQELKLYGPDERPFLDFVEINLQYRQAEEQAKQEQLRAEAAEQRAAKLAELLRQLGQNPDDLT